MPPHINFILTHPILHNVLEILHIYDLLLLDHCLFAIQFSHNDTADLVQSSLYYSQHICNYCNYMLQIIVHAQYQLVQYSCKYHIFLQAFLHSFLLHIHPNSHPIYSYLQTNTHDLACMAQYLFDIFSIDCRYRYGYLHA